MHYLTALSRALLVIALFAAFQAPAYANYDCAPDLQCDNLTSITRHDDGTVTLFWHQQKQVAQQRQIWLNNTEVLSKAYDLPSGFYSYHDPHVRPSGTTYQVYENFPPPDTRYWSKIEIRYELIRLPLMVQ